MRIKRDTVFTRHYQMHPAGSVLIETGNTKVICSATVQKGVPPFLDESKDGWITAEYGMLPSATNVRFRREAVKGKVVGRTAEIQRLIGRALRTVLDLDKIAGYTIFIDCDVIQADGGTRTTSITGAFVALHDAVKYMLQKNMIKESPIREMVAAVSVGIINQEIVSDLDYELDSKAETDMNIVMTESGKFVEIQGTAEKYPFDDNQLMEMLDAAKIAIRELINEQKKALEI